MPTETPLQCAAFDTATDGTCRRDTSTTIEMGLVTTPAEKRGSVVVESWHILVEVPICRDHEALLTAIEEEAEPLVGCEVAHLDGDARVLPTFRIAVNR